MVSAMAVPQDGQSQRGWTLQGNEEAGAGPPR